MINEEKTFKEFGYYSTDLSRWSSKLVYVRCSECKKYRTVRYQAYVKRKSDICIKCFRGVQRGPFNIEYFQAIQASVVESRINELRTFEEFGYYSEDLTKGSTNKVYLVCIKCGREWLAPMKRYIKGTGKCLVCVRADKSRELRTKCGEKNSTYGKHHTGETKCKMSAGNIGKHVSTETRRRSSATHQGIPYKEWTGFATDNPYCEKFNNECKEANRDKYGRHCFICGLPEFENITSTGKHQRLSVHHVDRNKNQGCNGVNWTLIPVCLLCHNKLHTSRMEACIEYILNEEKDENTRHINTTN